MMLLSRVVKVTQAEFDKLLEYAFTTPIKRSIGKRWKRRKEYCDGNEEWLIGEYVGVLDDLHIRWSNLEINDA